MANILLISIFGDAYAVATKFAEEGHDVKVYIKDPRAKRTGQGCKNPLTVDSWSPCVAKADMVLFDMVKMGKLADRIKASGKLVIGGSDFADTGELDRDIGQEMMKATGAIIPKSKTFNTVKECIKYIEKQDYPCVFKPIGNEYTAWTFVSEEDNAGLLSFLKSIKKDVPALIQQRVDGTEISTEGMFNGKVFTNFNHTIEKKRFMDGDVGPNTGCAGNVVWPCSRDKLVETLLIPLESTLRKAKYNGPVDVNSIVNKDGANFLELTIRFGYDAIQSLLSLTDKKYEYLLSSCCYRSNNEQKLRQEYSVAVRLSMPPYPHSDKGVEQLEGLEVIEAPGYLKKHLWLSDVMADEEGEPVMAGVDGVVGCATATADTVDKAIGSAYTVVNAVKINRDLQYRQDIGRGVQESIETLEENGWL